MKSNRGGARNFATEGLELPTEGLKKLKNGVSMRYFAKVPATRTKISSDGGLDASDGGAVAPLALPWRQHRKATRLMHSKLREQSRQHIA